MILYLLLIFSFGLITAIAMGTLIFGIIRQRKNLLVSGATLFIVGFGGFIVTAFSYTKKTISYVRSDQFQHGTEKGSELLGQTAGSVSTGLSKGLSRTLDDQAIADLARKSATIIGKSIKTMASALDSTIGNKNIFMDQNLADAGLEIGRADENFHSKTNDLEIFIEFKKNFKGKLKLTNYDQAGKKIDIAEKEIDGKAGQENAKIFSFSHSDLGITAYYILSKVE